MIESKLVNVCINYKVQMWINSLIIMVENQLNYGVPVKISINTTNV